MDLFALKANPSVPEEFVDNANPVRTDRILGHQPLFYTWVRTI
jgi:hypothetical protein